MTKAELMEYVGKKIYVYFKDGESGIYGLLGYADDFSEKHNYRKPFYFYIGHTSFKVSHVRKVEENEGNKKKDIDAQFLCKDCERYNLCKYYHNRKKDSYICKYFHLPDKLDKIRAEIEARLCAVVSDYTDGYRTAIQGVLNIIDQYKAESEEE